MSFTHVYRLEMRNRLPRIPYDRLLDLQPKQGWNIRLSVFTRFIWVNIVLNVSAEWKNKELYSHWNCLLLTFILYNAHAVSLRLFHAIFSTWNTCCTWWTYKTNINFQINLHFASHGFTNKMHPSSGS